jgi:hypothetical protein
MPVRFGITNAEPCWNALLRPDRLDDGLSTAASLLPLQAFLKETLQYFCPLGIWRNTLK